MPLKTIISTPQPDMHSVSSSGFYVKHDGKKVLASGVLSTGISTTSQLVAADTQAEVNAEVSRLGLTPLPLTPRQNAAAYFLALPQERQVPFLAVFEAVSVLPRDSDVLLAVQAVSVLDSTALADKDEILRLLGGGEPKL